MRLFRKADDIFVKTLSRLAYCNPFDTERIDLEREALGPDFQYDAPVWSLRNDPARGRPNITLLANRAETVLRPARKRLAHMKAVGDDEWQLYVDAVLFLLYHRYADRFIRCVDDVIGGSQTSQTIPFYAAFERDFDFYLAVPERHTDDAVTADHVFACCFQLARAFYFIYRFIVGSTMPAARLRAAVWQSIFTCDRRRYLFVLHDRMADMSTLITGPSGTGKELVARAIGMARYIPFDSTTRTFAVDFVASFHALNMSALSPTLIESELFGHRRGAFTGAADDRVGWLEMSGRLGTVFLDEIGEVSTTIQVKLLRVLQTRRLQRIGEVEAREFSAKVVAATNRDLAVEIREGRFRHDLYYRLCSDIIATPTLREQLAASDDELPRIVRIVAGRVAGDRDADTIAAAAAAWIRENLGSDYPWPGNFREMEQCIRSFIIRNAYRPLAVDSPEPATALASLFYDGVLTADDLLCRYCALVYGRTRNYEETARLLQLDRRTVKKKVDQEVQRLTENENVL